MASTGVWISIITLGGNMDEKPWLAHYDEGIPATVAPYSGTLLEKLDEAVEQHPEARGGLVQRHNADIGGKWTN